MANKNPLGSAAGYGTSFPINRMLTTQLLNMPKMHYNVVYAQMTRGKTEKWMADGLAAIAATLSKLAYDCCLYMSQNFGFIRFPDHLTTGSSIMPHKKNPDVFELIRAKCNVIQATPVQLNLLLNNLPSGYHRDFQLTKSCLFPAIDELKLCLTMMNHMLQHIAVKADLLSSKKYDTLFSVEAVNQLVMQGESFREAYRTIGKSIEEDNFIAEKELNHTHEGSMGNLCLDKICDNFKEIVKKFDY
jgi:argininosuccinate lyase